MNSARRFSTNTDVVQPKKASVRATPGAGFKVPKLKEGEEEVAFRPRGNTNILENRNYNFELARRNNEKHKGKFVVFFAFLTMIPFAFFVSNAENNFRKANVKQIATKRREKLDKEHGIDREVQRESFK